MQEKSGGKFIKWVVLILVAFIVIFQLYQSFYSPVTTGSVVHYETYNGIEINAVAIRDEQVLTTSDSGVLSYGVSDGGKIESGGVVADIYASEEDANTETEIEQMENTIKDLEDVNGVNNSQAVDIDLLDSKIDAQLCTLINESSDGLIDAGKNTGAELLKQLNRRQIATGVSSDYSSLIKSYKARLEALKARKSGAKAYVKAKKSGYFVSGTDGYETELKTNGLSSLTADKLNAVKPYQKKYKGTVVGKIVSDYEWYLAATVSLDDSLKLKPDEKYTLLTNFESCQKLPVTVKQINKGSSGDKAVVVFTCTYMNSDLATMRSHNMTVVLETYSGLSVSSRAIRFVDGKKGVYVLSGSVINFVPIEVLYATDNYCICEMKTTGVRLKLYDEVIIKGKNLYDGKVID